MGRTLWEGSGRVDLMWPGCRAQKQGDSSYNEINEDTHAGESNNGSFPGGRGQPTGQDCLTNCITGCLYIAPLVY